jgi:two-component system, NtrC family, sensor histidine kinase KinB
MAQSAEAGEAESAATEMEEILTKAGDSVDKASERSMAVRWEAMPALVLVAAALALAFAVDAFVLPGQRDEIVYALPVLIAAHRWPARHVFVTGMAVCLLALALHVWAGSLRVELVFSVAALVAVAYLGVRLAQQAEESQQRLRSAERTAVTLRTLIDTLPVGVVVSDITGELTLLNPVALAIFGGKLGNAYGTEGVALRHLDGSPFAAAELPLPRALELGEETREVQLALYRTGGDDAILSVAAAPVRSPGGQVVGAVSVFSDITESYQVNLALRESEARYRRIVETAGEGVWVLDADHNTVFVNRRLAEMLGCSAEEMRGQPLLAYVAPEARGAAFTHLRRRGPGTQRDFQFRRPDGSTLWAILSTTAIVDSGGRYGGLLAMVTDITERKRAEQTRDEYLGLISHDLRQPLTVISGMAEWLYADLQRREMTREAGAAERILKSGQRMATMIKDLVESVRLESGNLELHKERTDLARLLRDTVDHLGSEKERVRLLAPETSRPVLVDPARLERVVVNLLSNALKYSPAERPVTLSLVTRSAEVVVAVQDEGVGIPVAEQGHLFERFYRASTCQKSEGLGLGLYIARLIVEAHDGRVWVESEQGRGSTFFVALPLSDAVEPAEV